MNKKNMAMLVAIAMIFSLFTGINFGTVKAQAEVTNLEGIIAATKCAINVSGKTNSDDAKDWNEKYSEYTDTAEKETVAVSKAAFTITGSDDSSTTNEFHYYIDEMNDDAYKVKDLNELKSLDGSTAAHWIEYSNQKITLSDYAGKQIVIYAKFKLSDGKVAYLHTEIIEIAKVTPMETPTATPTATPQGGYAEITSHDKMKIYEDTATVVIGDTGYELYNYVPSIASSYAKAINKAAKLYGPSATIYDIIVPTSVGITMPDNKLAHVNSTPQDKAIKKIFAKLEKPVQTISLYDALMQHRQEYVYYRTDHHWTSKGAYYGYVGICEKLGISPHALSEYKKKKFGSFIGTYYGDTNGNKNFRKDELAAYYPVSDKISMKYQNESGKIVNGHVIVDSSKYGISNKYLAFLEGDNAYTVITNKNIKDSSSCVVVKESFGNALVPYLTDHFSKIYVIDYRYWNGKLSHLVKDKKIQKIFFINNISMTRNSYLVGKLNQQIR